ncbi:hypothetical protein AJ80_02405 [Polytolypa hystricis UAMH7299]|uniref:Endoplasmic reticulum protein n=1 Tax=Polytolypa hystricis (strain UAMH7299) TaxID=1447883 RepID=A0A2B7YRG5_POLH7|nr:hypothetical protein AJ80_02405 [Polytolypa hystricis UAMH7299]
MAPLPPANLPLGERLKMLAQTLQFGWFLGHFTLILAVFRYFLSYITFNSGSGMAQASYRFAFVAAAATYGIVVYKGYIARGKLSGSPPAMVLKLAGDENVQYLVMALVWLCSRQIPLALLPFTIYSVFHVATYTRTYLIPTIQPPKPADPNSSSGRVAPNALADSIGRFVKMYYDASMGLVASLEMALLFRLIGSALTFSKASWVLLIVYFSFFRARYAQSTFVQGAVAHATARVDAAVSHQGTPLPVRQGWEAFKGIVRRVYDATDARRYLGRFQQPAGKKPQ